jgi:hypothetical protein
VTPLDAEIEGNRGDAAVCTSAGTVEYMCVVKFLEETVLSNEIKKFSETTKMEVGFPMKFLILFL